MTSVELNKAIAANKLPSLIYLYGEEAFLLEESLTAVMNAVVDVASRDFNLLVISAKEVNAVDLIDTARTFPVFAARRMIVVKQAQNLSAAVLEALLPYIAAPVDECCLVFCADRIDKRKKFFQTFKKHGQLVEFKPLYANKIPPFVPTR